MKKSIHFEINEDIVDIRKDNVFKAVFTRETPASRIALSKLVSAFIGREVTIVAIAANELPVDSVRDRQLRFDINCRAENGELVNVEMCFNPEPFEPVRMEFYAGKLFTGQDIRGEDKDYCDLKQAYQIAVLANKRFFPNEAFYHTFEYYDPVNGVSLNGKTRIITLELSKLGNVVEKSTEEMTTQEQWAIFFQYLTDKSKREKINKIAESEEGIAMASEVVMTISRDEEERARIMRDEKILLDYQCYMASAKKQGRKEGLEEGHEEGLKEGLKEGIEIGSKNRDRYFLELLDQGLSVEEIKQRIGG